MKGILLCFGASAGSAVGWWIGNYFGLMTAIVLSGIGTGLGVWGTRWLMREYLD